MHNTVRTRDKQRCKIYYPLIGQVESKGELYKLSIMDISSSDCRFSVWFLSYCVILSANKILLNIYVKY